ncbi:hypothetical protein R1flu_012358 [Riccia fluitans]|uniref:Uncharacterized protein n=1 Tax=Riccia fluitans TaxID=41844 RepID=A0ABD1ZAH6_9MARC
MLSDDTKNSLSPFIDQMLCKFFRPGCKRVFANASGAIANVGDWFTSGAIFRLESLTRDVLGHPGQTVAQNEACFVSLESSRKMLSNDTKNTLSTFIDKKLCKFSRLGYHRTFISVGKAFASAGE